MTKYKLVVEYDGSPYVGWQRQKNGMSVQQALEEAAHAFCSEECAIKGAGRTDTGVHALGQVADVDIAKETSTDQVRDALNFHLKPHPIAVLSAEEVGDEFSSRFDALQRHYLYQITDRRPPLTVTKKRSWHVPIPLDVDAMHAAAQTLVGKHDFTTFRSSNCQSKSPLKTVDRIAVSRVGEELHVTVAARSFLHNQVRSFVGALKLVGEGKWIKKDLQASLEAKDRTACAPIAPPHGLYLERVDYP